MANPMHELWSAVAPAWASHAEFVDRRAAGLTGAMLDAVALRPGDRVLELACGAGGVTLAAAPRVEPSGEVVCTDVADAMVEVARERAASLGLGNVTTRRRDLENIDEPDGAFDAVLCREGLMFTV